MHVTFYDPSYQPGQPLIYSIIAARFMDKWIFVRHNGQTGWEIAGGHIEEGESPYCAAARELTEETGAERFSLECVATYSVASDEYLGYGRLFLAVISALGDIRDKAEIAEIMFSDILPSDLTYPDLHPVFLQKCTDYLNAPNTT